MGREDKVKDGKKEKNKIERKKIIRNAIFV